MAIMKPQEEEACVFESIEREEGRGVEMGVSHSLQSKYLNIKYRNWRQKKGTKNSKIRTFNLELN